MSEERIELPRELMGERTFAIALYTDLQRVMLAVHLSSRDK